ncbi:hypothetical protein WOSG25_230100 [Weissella oryzae SG25]|uniref:Uncharacterized protein n=1 Tax=Weissella oryzae (strain DSM 25784 / JCM 18191 / LMG 30913 / SG25) TaxID=1329250 RepID=A0A069CXA2_WEIOS|nr:hypothetical protein [Weissella oryzae]GAK32002.1 hypothetical protein WOSG25_230100 [Weissella oryzae SG25]
MRYNQRAKIVTRTYDVEDSENDYEESISDWLAVRITGVSIAMSMQIFGKANSTASAIHFKGNVYGIDSVIIDGIKRKPQAVFRARKNTVVIVTEV